MILFNQTHPQIDDEPNRQKLVIHYYQMDIMDIIILMDIIVQMITQKSKLMIIMDLLKLMIILLDVSLKIIM